MTLLFIGTDECSRNKQYIYALERQGHLKYEVCPWSDFANVSHATGSSRDDILIRFGCPWHEKNLESYFAEYTGDVEPTTALHHADLTTTYRFLSGNIHAYTTLLERIVDAYPNATFVNSPIGLKIAGNKLLTYGALADVNVRYPPTFRVDREFIAGNLTGSLNRMKRLFIKPATGARGLGTGVLDLKDGRIRFRYKADGEIRTVSGASVMDVFADLVATGEPVIAQEHISSALWNGLRFELRAMFVANQLYICHTHTNDPAAICTHSRYGGEISIGPIIERVIPDRAFYELQEGLRRLSKSIGLSTFAIDAILAEDDLNLNVLEINAHAGDYFFEQIGFNPSRIEIENIVT